MQALDAVDAHKNVSKPSGKWLNKTSITYNVYDMFQVSIGRNYIDFPFISWLSAKINKLWSCKLKILQNNDIHGWYLWVSM